MQLTSKIERLLFETPTWKFLAVIFTLCVVKTGVWWYPNPLALWAMAQNPFASPFTQPDEHYLMWNWLGPWLAWLIGATSMTTLFLFFLACALGFVALFARVVLVQLPREQARTALVLFALLPVSTTALFWVGQDGLTLLLLMAALAFPGMPLVTLATGVLLGLQHFEQGFFAAAGLGVAALLGRRGGVTLPYGLRFCLLLAGGAVLGKLGLVVLFRHYEIHVNSGRMYWLRNHLGMMLAAFFLHLQGIAWTLLGTAWLAVARFARLGRRSLPFFVALGCLFLLAAITADHTRVLAAVTFPLLMACWLLNQEFLASISRRETALLFGVWLLLPMTWVWVGVSKWSLFPYDVAWLLHQAFGWFALPDSLFAWPFQ